MVDCKYIDLKERGVEKIPSSMLVRCVINEKWFQLFGGLERKEQRKAGGYMNIAILSAHTMMFIEEYAQHMYGLHAFDYFAPMGKSMGYIDEWVRTINRVAHSKEIDELEKVAKEMHEFTVELLSAICADSWKELYYHNDDWEEMKKEYTKQYEVD